MFGKTLCAAAMFGAVACAAESTEASLATTFSLSKSAELPGARLKAGTYTLRMLDRLPDRYVLELSKPDGSKAISTFLAVPDGRLPNTAKGTPIYWANSGRVPVIRGMRLNGLNTAAAFVFPKAEAAALAKKVGSPVPAIDPDSEGKKAVAGMTDADRQIVTLWVLSAVAVTPEGKDVGIQASKYVPPVLVAKAEAPAGAETVAAGNVEPERAPVPKMPKTAGNFAGYCLAGFLLVTVGSSLAYFVRRMS